MTTLFLCWSGDRSRAAAGVLTERLPAIVPGLDCVMSTQIDAGSLWSAELQRRLDSADAGLVCLTREAVGSPWLHYEAGMLSTAVGRERGEPRLFTYLLDLEQQELSGPLSAYQSAAATRDGTAQLVDSLLRFAGRSAAVDFDPWWSDVSEALERIPPMPLEEVIPDLEDLFRGQTFVEPVPECTDQRWLRRHVRARDVHARLDSERARVHAACRPAVVDLYDELCRLVRGYAMDLEAYFIDEKRFDPDQATGLLDVPEAALSAERRRADIAARLSQLVESGRAPITEEAPRFALATTFAERKDLVHKKEAEIDAGREVLAQEDIQRAASSAWAFDRIVHYLVLERSADVPLGAALRGVTVELEKVRTEARAAPSHMPLHYALGPLETAARRLRPGDPEAGRIDAILNDVERQIEDRDESGQMADTIDRIRRALRRDEASRVPVIDSIKILREGPAAWNARRAEAGDDLSHVQIRNADLRGADFRGVDFDGSEIVNVDLSGADLSGAHLNGVAMERVRLEQATLTGAECKGTDLERVYLRAARLDRVDAFELKVKRSDLTEVTLREARLRSCHIYNCDLSGAAWDGLETQAVTLKRVVAAPQLLDDLRGMGCLVELPNVPRDGLIDWSSATVPDRASGRPLIVHDGRAYWFNVDGWDFFISHATADKESFARPLARELEALGQRVWLDAGEVKPNDRLNATIAHGARAANFGVAILSPRFLGREWTERELELLDGDRLFLVLHDGFTLGELERRRPTLRSKVTLTSDPGPAEVARQLVDALSRPPGEL